MLYESTAEAVRSELEEMGYILHFDDHTSGFINAFIYFDWHHGITWGGSGNHGEDYGSGW